MQNISRRLALVLAVLVLLPPIASGQADSSAKPRRIFRELPYGSDAQFNPVNVVLNEGFDMLRIITERRAIGEIPYGQSSGSLWNTLTHADAVVRHYGVGRWIRDEVLPLSVKGDGGAWLPNYQLHLFGAGMTYSHLAEWYDARGVGHPRIASAATMYVGHFLNEIVENAGNQTGESEESLTDLLLFDPAGMLLWNTSWMRRAFSGSWEVNNWYGQPTWMPRTGRLENSFSAYFVRGPLPKTDAWKLFLLNGNTPLGGVSRRIRDSVMVSIGGGALSTGDGLAPNFGLFVDRNGSLLASFVNRTGNTNGATLNVYPGVLRIGRASAGLWIQSVHGGYDRTGIRWGITSKLGGGLGSVSR